MFNTLINESYNGSLPFVEIFEKVLPFLMESGDEYDQFYLEVVMLPAHQ